MDTLRLSDFTFSTICRIGITLSTCFWTPASLLLGVAGAMDVMPVQGLQGDTHGVLGFIGTAFSVLSAEHCRASGVRLQWMSCYF